MLRRALLVCGIVAPVLYIGTDILAATLLYQGYRYADQQVSELSAIGAPTRSLWIGMTDVWTALVIAFALGVWLSAGPKRSLRVTAALLGAFGLRCAPIDRRQDICVIALDSLEPARLIQPLHVRRGLLHQAQNHVQVSLGGGV